MKVKVVRKEVLTQEVVYDCLNKEEGEAIIARRGTDHNWDCLPRSVQTTIEVKFEETPKLVIDLETPTENIKELVIGDQIEIFTREEIISAGYEVNGDKDIVFPTLEFPIEHYDLYVELINDLKNNVVVWDDSEHDFKVMKNGLTLSNVMIKKVYR